MTDRRRWIALAAAVALQALLVALVPVPNLLTRATGTEIVLKVVPFDPYSLLSGYYLQIGYEMTRPEAAPGFEAGNEVYAVLEEGADGLWHPVRCEKTPPAGLPPGQVALRGRHLGWRVEFGIERLYIPEANRFAAEQDLRANMAEARAVVRVDRRGNAALLRLLVGDRVYE